MELESLSPPDEDAAVLQEQMEQHEVCEQCSLRPLLSGLDNVEWLDRVVWLGSAERHCKHTSAEYPDSEWLDSEAIL